MATTGHETETINVAGLKASLQKFKTDLVDPKQEASTAVTAVSYDTTNKKITKTVGSTTSDVVTVATLKTDMALDNVTNDAQVKRSEMGAASGVATLDENGLVPSSQLPSYVDDVVELLAISATAPEHCSKGDLYFNTTTSKVVRATGTDTWGTSSATNTDPEKGKIYVNLTDDKTYRWSGSTMIEIASSDVIGIKVGSSGSTLSPSQGIITIPEYETGAQVNPSAATPSTSGSGGTDGLMTAQDKEKLNGIEAGADVTDATNVKAALSVVQQSQDKYLKDDGTWDTPPNTEYESKAAASGGTDVSLVTTGEKYTWGQKQDAIVFNTAYDATTNKAATMSDIPSSLPASDVYAWAKAATKPDYTLSEVGYSASVVAISSATSSSCSVTGAENTGKQETIIYTNSTGGDLVVTVPTTYTTPDGQAIELTCPSGGYVEVSYINISGTIYARGL